MKSGSLRTAIYTDVTQADVADLNQGVAISIKVYVNVNLRVFTWNDESCACARLDTPDSADCTRSLNAGRRNLC